MPAVKTPDLQERREELKAKLSELQSQQVDIVRDLEAAQQEWKAAVEAGKSTTAIVERRRHREAELEENGRQAAHFGALVADVDAELQRRVPHEVLDRDVRQHADDLESYAELAGKLEGAHQRAVDATVTAATELHGLVAAVRQWHDELANRAHHLRVTASQLNRVDVTIPGPTDWNGPVFEEVRGTHLQGLYQDTIRVNTATHDIATSLGNTARAVMYNRNNRP